MAQKTVYYDDAQNDDFANTALDGTFIPPDFHFAVTNPAWRIIEFAAYRIVAAPAVWIIAKAGYGLKIKNKRAIRKLKKTGYYLYGNHTQGMMDAYTPSLVAFPKHAHIVVGSAALSSPLLGFPVRLLGGIPVPGSTKGIRPFTDALSLRIDQRRVVAVYPEAHIWPWYTGVRPYSDVSFTYPVKDNVPAVAFVTTYRKRKIFKNLHPYITVTLSEPFYPDVSSGKAEARRKLRDQVYGFMCRETSKPDNYAYRVYIKKETDKDK
ncbi:MAG: hypothetical protein J5879_00380 [Clostridia bacterium]|nr:hypothetical protein [Clostridia bacterium]